MSVVRSQHEKELVKTFIKTLKGYCIIDRVEQSMNMKSGFSDLVYSILQFDKHLFPIHNESTTGFIEAKYRPSWPKRERTPITLDHFTKNQKLFLHKHGEAKRGGCFLLLLIDHDVMLFNYKVAQCMNTLNKSDMLDLSLIHFKDYTNGWIQSRHIILDCLKRF